MSILASFSLERAFGFAGAALLPTPGRAAVLELSIWAGAAGAVADGAPPRPVAAGGAVAPPPNKPGVGPAGAVGFAGAPAGAAGCPKSPPPLGAGGF